MWFRGLTWLTGCLFILVKDPSPGTGNARVVDQLDTLYLYNLMNLISTPTCIQTISYPRSRHKVDIFLQMDVTDNETSHQ